jgi:hypothetical protein
MLRGFSQLPIDRRKKEEGRRKKEEGRRKKEDTAMPFPYPTIIVSWMSDVTIARLIVGTRHCLLVST